MAYVPVPKDLTAVKTKVMFNLTKRQLVCFGSGAGLGVPIFFLGKSFMGTSAATMVLVIVMLPFMLMAMYEKNGQPLEVVGRQIIESCFLRPKERPYQTNNAYSALIRQYHMEKEVKAIVQSSKARSGQRKKRGGQAQTYPRRKKRN